MLQGSQEDMGRNLLALTHPECDLASMSLTVSPVSIRHASKPDSPTSSHRTVRLPWQVWSHSHVLAQWLTFDLTSSYSIDNKLVSGVSLCPNLSQCDEMELFGTWGLENSEDNPFYQMPFIFIKSQSLFFSLWFYCEDYPVMLREWYDGMRPWITSIRKTQIAYRVDIWMLASIHETLKEPSLGGSVKHLQSVLEVFNNTRLQISRITVNV